MSKIDKLQYLLIKSLLQDGEVELILPNGIELKVGITQEGKHGKEKTEDYCWLTATQQDRTVILDSYNLGLQFPKEDKLVCENDYLDDCGQAMIGLDVV
jgi:hypothetical protein